ncbi:MAG: hypothetical protein GY722_02395 [bacterium]|nr:hypothetical protein [bacterium]
MTLNTGWLCSDKPAGEALNLEAILSYSSDNYSRQIDWYHHHKNFAIKNVAAILAAEFALLSLWAKLGLPEVLAATALVFLSIVSLLLTLSGLDSCRSSYQAALEHIFVANKCLWAMGAGGKVFVPSERPGRDLAPLKDDPMLGAPRHLNDSRQRGTITELVEKTLANPHGTFKRTRKILWLFGGSSVVAGVGCAATVMSLL